jgi:hypothetical protein
MSKLQEYHTDPYINALMQGNIHGNKHIRADVTLAINDRLRVRNEELRANAQQNAAKAAVMTEQRLAKKRGRK